MPKKRQPAVPITSDPTPAIVQVSGYDPSIWDMDTAIQPWTTLVNQTLPDLFNAINYLRGIIDGL